MQGIYQEFWLADFLNIFKYLKRNAHVLEMLKGGNKRGSANSGVGAGGVRDV